MRNPLPVRSTSEMASPTKLNALIREFQRTQDNWKSIVTTLESGKSTIKETLTPSNATSGNIGLLFEDSGILQ